MNVLASFEEQSRACARLGSPFMAGLMRLFAERLEPGSAVKDAILSWAGDPRSNADNVSLRIAGGLHRLLLEGRALGNVYPPATPGDDELWQALEDTFVDHEEHLLEALTRAPQTNEVRRAAAILPALHLVAGLWNRPIALYEIGCSGGLNLRADHFALRTKQNVLGPKDASVTLVPVWSGPAPALADLKVSHRAGVDLAPIDPGDPDGEMRLLSYLWPDQPERLERTRAAVAVARDVPADIDCEDAGPWLERRLSNRPQNQGSFVFHTIAAQYFSPQTRARADAALDAAGRLATPTNPLAHFAMEADGGRGAGLTLTLWPGGISHSVGRADFHGQWVDWFGLP